MRCPDSRALFCRVALLLALGAVAYLAWVYPRSSEQPVGVPGKIYRGDARVGYYSLGDGPRIVLLASLGRSVGDFNDLAPRLAAAGYRTLAIESRGVGSTTLPGDDIESLYQLADDIEAVLQADSVDEQVVIVGHAFGNRVARAYAHRYPQRVRAVALLASGGAQKLTEMPDVLRALRGCFSWWLPPPMRMDHVRYAFFADNNEVPRQWRYGWYLRSSLAQARAVARTPEREWRAAGGVAPVLVIQGDDDRVAPAALTSAKLLREMPERVVVHTIPQAGHALLPEAPDAIAASLLAFVASPNAFLPPATAASR